LKIIIPVSVGELLDKISILTDNSYVIKEREHLIQIAKENDVYNQEFLNQLLEVNSKLWTIEDKLRELEKEYVFDEDFIQLARL